VCGVRRDKAAGKGRSGAEQVATLSLPPAGTRQVPIPENLRAGMTFTDYCLWVPVEFTAPLLQQQPSNGGGKLGQYPRRQAFTDPLR